MKNNRTTINRPAFKTIRLLTLLVVALLFLVSCAPREAQSQVAPEATQAEVAEDSPAEGTDEVILTLDELKAYNGKNGMPAYLAHDGIIYDVSTVPQWASGEHNGIKAGTDITGIIEKAPHGVKNLKLGTPIGKIAD